MPPSSRPALLLLLAALLAGAAAFSFGLTQKCHGLPAPDVEDCRHGLVRDFCGRMTCAKGPGERCGGPSSILGKCVEGTHCKCEKCIGCSLYTFECDVSNAFCNK